MTPVSPQNDLNNGHSAHATVRVPNALDRAYKRYADGAWPYSVNDTLDQKLWSVVNRELGPGAADVLVQKLVQAVGVHITQTGDRR
jgi:hypothetical protein